MSALEVRDCVMKGVWKEERSAMFVDGNTYVEMFVQQVVSMTQVVVHQAHIHEINHGLEEMRCNFANLYLMVQQTRVIMQQINSGIASKDIILAS